MNTKYGKIDASQIRKYKQELHNRILSFLYLKEENCSTLDDYFAHFLWKLDGYNHLFGDQPVMIDIMSELEEARITASKVPYDHKKYRKLILDAFNLIDNIAESDGDDNA